MSTTFIDGPAKGKRLQLSRSPIVLRVVQAADGTIDALDQLEDTAGQGEAIYVYILTEKPSGYRLLIAQPKDEEVRDNARFAAWCNANRDTLIPEWAKGNVEP